MWRLRLDGLRSRSALSQGGDASLLPGLDGGANFGAVVSLGIAEAADECFVLAAVDGVAGGETLGGEELAEGEDFGAAMGAGLVARVNLVDGVETGVEADVVDVAEQWDEAGEIHHSGFVRGELTGTELGVAVADSALDFLFFGSESGLGGEWHD